MAKPLSGDGNAPQYTHDIHQNWLSTLDPPEHIRRRTALRPKSLVIS
jgi:cytochrome P450